MTIQPGFVGCDISKDHLDIFDDAFGKPERIANEAAALAPLIDRWKNKDRLVLFEATGPYDACLRARLKIIVEWFQRLVIHRICKNHRGSNGLDRNHSGAA